MAKIGDFLKLEDIIDRHNDQSISLPTVQRGFVWKPHQIENLWDSLLRGYPIGSFVFAKEDSSSEKFELLDGQQRASSICLGFYDPLVQSETDIIFKTSFENFLVFIDLFKPDGERDNRKYLFRVITKSHPWGYRRQENQKTLESKNITKAMKEYRLSNYDYLKKPLKEFWPYDSYKPIPLGLFIKAKSMGDLIVSIKKWKESLGFRFNEDLPVLVRSEKTPFYSIREIYEDVQSMLQNQRIPLLFLELSKLFPSEKAKRNSTIAFNALSENKVSMNDVEELFEDENDMPDSPTVEDRNVSQIENLFIRLNSGGTPLRGEELNYSLLKSKIHSELQREIETACKGLFHPARFITIAFRLFSNDPEQPDNRVEDSLSMRIKPKQFQRMISGSQKNAFVQFVKDFLLSETLNKMRELLTYSNSNKIGLPQYVVNSLSDRAPEIVFMLLFRLYYLKDKIGKALLPNVIGIMTLFSWLGKGEKQKDYLALLKNIWPCVRMFNTKQYWSSETIERALMLSNGYEILTPFPTYLQLKSEIPKQADIRALTSEGICNNQFGDFIYKMFFEKEILLYAQREALHRWFGEIEDVFLDDTNRAFDWDHISPLNLVYSRRKIHPALKNWYNSNGNIRAWKYSLNRSDHDTFPDEKLSPSSKEDINWWAQHLQMSRITQIELKKKILSDSAIFNGQEWLQIDWVNVPKRIKESVIAKKLTYCILNRNIQLCSIWYENLKIDELIPTPILKKEIKVLFFDMLNRKQWCPSKDEENYRYEFPILNNAIVLLFSFSTSKNILDEDSVFFGIQDKKNNILPYFSIPVESADKILIQDGFLCTWLTLYSGSENSKIRLLSEVYHWLHELPNFKLKSFIVEKFFESIKLRYRSKIVT